MKLDDPERMVRTCLYLPVGLRDRLQLAAARQRVSMAQVMRVALEASVNLTRPEPVGGFLEEPTSDRGSA